MPVANEKPMSCRLPNHAVRPDKYVMVLRKEHRMPLVELDTLDAMDRGLNAIGMRRDTVFFKSVFPTPIEGMWNPFEHDLPKCTFHEYDLSRRRASITMIREFLQLSLMHKALPKHALKPLAIATHGSRAVGYFTPLVYAETAAHVLERLGPGKKAEEFKGRVFEVVRKFHSKGLGHGDLLYLANVFILRDGTIMLYDPDRPIGLNNKELIRFDTILFDNDFEPGKTLE